MNTIINTLLQQNNMTMYRLHKESQLPKTTIADICSGKSALAKCSAETLYKLAKALNVSMEYLIEESSKAQKQRASFETYKSNVCHYLKDLGDIDFLIKVFEGNIVRKLFDKGWYPEALYLLAMIDYLCEINDINQCSDYNDIRQMKLSKPIYPLSVLMLDEIMGNDAELKYCEENAIPQFKRFNIYEVSIRDVK